MDKRIYDICNLNNSLISWAMENKECGTDGIPVYGQVVDMIKDLTEAEKNCYEACYYKSVVEAMEDAEKNQGRMGYDHWHYSNGRFAPTGHGHRSGYTNMPEIYNIDPTSMTRENMKRNHYDHFVDARRHYHESRSPEDKKEMDMHAKEHLNEVISTSRDIFNDASPEMKKRMKQDLTAMINAWQV